MKSREKALKRGTWFRGITEDEPWKSLPSTRSSERICKNRKIFRRAGKKANPESSAGNTTVVFVLSTRGSILIQSLKAEEDQMAELTGFRVKYQEAGGSTLANAFNKNLGIGKTCIESGGKVDCKARSIVYESK